VDERLQLADLNVLHVHLRRQRLSEEIGQRVAERGKGDTKQKDVHALLLLALLPVGVKDMQLELIDECGLS
jgi:hypothetical protein